MMSGSIVIAAVCLGPFVSGSIPHLFLGRRGPPPPPLRSTSRPAAIGVGWHDEMNDISAWKARNGGMPAEMFASRPGEMKLRLAHVPDGYPFAYQWGGVTRAATVDLGRYPILVMRVSGMGPGSYCHMDVEQFDYSGKPVKTLRMPTLESPGVAVFDLGKEYGPYVWRLVLRINVGGKLEGAEAEVSWIRFVRREDVPLLKEVPDLQAVKLNP